jgi:hypothetical protein
MANYRTLLRYFPVAQDYLNQRKWIRRGDVLAYAPWAQTPSFSTDISPRCERKPQIG